MSLMLWGSRMFTMLPFRLRHRTVRGNYGYFEATRIGRDAKLLSVGRSLART
jgi:hypothetical protein